MLKHRICNADIGGKHGLDNLAKGNGRTMFLNPTPTPNGFYWGHQCSWTLAPANSRSPTWSLTTEQEVTRPKTRLKPTSSK